jgi:large-conductance mechanosensitive channel
MLSPSYTTTVDENGVAMQTLDLANSIYIDWGSFISAIINFLLIAIVLFTIVKIINGLNDARDKAEDEVADIRKKNKAIYKIKKAEKVSFEKATELYEARVAEAAAAKAAEEAAAAEKAAEEARIAEEKAMQNTVLLQEILAVLKNK